MSTTTRISQWVRTSVKGLKPYASARDEFSDTSRPMVLLDANESPFETGVNRYPDPQQRALKTLLAGQLGVSEAQMLLGNGSDEVLDLLFRAFCEPYRDTVITLPPTFGMFKVLAGVNAVGHIEIPLDHNFQPDVKAVLDASGPNTRILFLCSPNNPTGNLMHPDRIRELLEGFPGLVVVDEAYVQFSASQELVADLKRYDNLVLIRTFSKAFGLAGIRLGLCMANPEVIRYLNRIKMPYNVNELTQQRALQVLSDPERVDRDVALLQAERQRLQEALRGLTLVQHIFPSEANFLLIRVDDATRRYTELLEAGIVARNRSSELQCENTLRITIGTPEENDRLLEALTQLDKTHLL